MPKHLEHELGERNLQRAFVISTRSVERNPASAPTPVPLAAKCCGLVDALSWTESVALCAPLVLGVNPIAIVQVARCASPPPGQVVPVSANSGSFEVTLPMNSRFDVVLGAAWSCRVRKSCIWSPSPK